jgi:hypothetical protein
MSDSRCTAEAMGVAPDRAITIEPGPGNAPATLAVSYLVAPEAAQYIAVMTVLDGHLGIGRPFGTAEDHKPGQAFASGIVDGSGRPSGRRAAFVLELLRHRGTAGQRLSMRLIFVSA